jgi:hypothetical protein
MLREPTLVIESVANDEEWARLGLFLGEMVYRIDSVHGRGDQRLLESVRLPAALFPLLQKPVPSLRQLVDTYGLQLGVSARSSVCCPSHSKYRQSSRHYARQAGPRIGQSNAPARRRPVEWRRITYSSGLAKLARLIAKLGT